MDSHEFLHEVMSDALLEDKHEMVQILIDNGVHLESFIGESSLAELYDKVSYNCHGINVVSC